MYMISKKCISRKVPFLSVDDKEYLYPSKDSVKAEITFWRPNKAVLQHLTLGGSGDLDVNSLKVILVTEDLINTIIQYFMI